MLDKRWGSPDERNKPRAPSDSWRREPYHPRPTTVAALKELAAVTSIEEFRALKNSWTGSSSPLRQVRRHPLSVFWTWDL